MDGGLGHSSRRLSSLTGLASIDHPCAVPEICRISLVNVWQSE